MRVARRSLMASAMALLAAPFVLRQARGEAAKITLKLHHALSSVSRGHDKFLAPWARKVEADAEGRIRIEIFPSMQLGGAPAQLFDQARDGFVDIVWAMPLDTPGRFPKIELFELPFVSSRRALVSSKAVAEFGEVYLKDEFREVHPICFSCADRGLVHAGRPVAAIADLEGMRLHVQTRFAGEAVRLLGGRAVPMPSAQLPLAVSQHVIDGCIDPWHVVPALKLHDLLKSHTDFAELSLSTTTLVLAMNKAAYDRLPAELKKVIDDNSGQFAAGLAGAMWDLEAAAVLDMVQQRGDSVTTLAPEAVAPWRRATAPVLAAWLKQMKARKINGDKLLDSAGAMLAKYHDEPEPPPAAAKPQPPEQALGARPDAQSQSETAKSPAPQIEAQPATPSIAVPTPSTAPLVPAVKPTPAAKPPPKTLDIPL